MQQKIKKYIKNIIPSFLFKLIGWKTGQGFFGNYKTWNNALSKSKGYNSPIILKKVKDSLLKVKNNNTIYERDSMIFNKTNKSSPFFYHIIKIVSQNDNKLSIIDFGGSLGSTYFQHKDSLIGLKELKWDIIEQNNFVECGKKYFENDHLKFWLDINTCIRSSKHNVVLFSSSIQYLEKPYEILEEFTEEKIPYIIFDRTPFWHNDEEERITVQKIPKRIYRASYPAWILNKEKMKKFFIDKGYECVKEIKSQKKTTTIDTGETIEFDGFVFKIR